MSHGAASVQQFEAFNSAISRICGAYRVECDRWWDFRGGIATRRIGSLEVADIGFSGGTVIKDGRRDEFYMGDRYFLVLQAAGTASMRQRGNEARLQSGDCTLIDSRFPSVFEVGSGFHQYSFHLPANLVRNCFEGRTVHVARRIAGDRGAGAILSEMLHTILRHADSLDGEDPAELTVELLRRAIGHASPEHPFDRSERSTLQVGDIANYIDTRLNRLDLKPQEIADHFNVSLRQLYRIAALAGYTPAALIWRRRLHRARQLLMDPTNHMPITDIALNCGFKDAAHFSRSYRKSFGAAPRVARRASGQTSDVADSLLVAC